MRREKENRGRKGRENEELQRKRVKKEWEGAQIRVEKGKREHGKKR